MKIRTINFARDLEHWLSFDVWTAHDAIRLFCECDPNESEVRLLGLIPFDPQAGDSSIAGHAVDAEIKESRLWEIWRSGVRAGNHENEFYPPAYFINWAKEKRIDIPWLAWAESQGWVPSENPVQDVAVAPVEMKFGHEIRGQIIGKLVRAIEEYPAKYQGKNPKLDDDVRPWLKAEFDCSDREASVFGAILAEHFDLTTKGGK